MTPRNDDVNAEKQVKPDAANGDSGNTGGPREPIVQTGGQADEGKEQTPIDKGKPTVEPESTDTTGGVTLPEAGLRDKRNPFWPIVLILAVFGVVGYFTFSDMFKSHQRITVYFEDLHGLRVGSPLEHRGDQIGEVVEIERPSDLGRRKVVIELIDDPNIVKLLCRDGNEFFISRFSADHLQLKGVTKVIRGPGITVRLGSPEGQNRDEFQGSNSLPPDPRVAWNSVRVTITFTNVQGLTEGALVMDRGRETGVVEKVIPDTEGDTVTVTVAFFTTDPATCSYVRESTRYFINKAKLSTRGVEGDASTVLYGSHLVVVPDPLNSNAKIVSAFRGRQESPPEYLPRMGEKQVILESSVWLPPDTPVVFRGELAGYVMSVQQASDSNSFYLMVRIYPSMQPQICEKTVFFVPAKFKGQLFKARGLFDWEGPRFEVPDPQMLLRPAIEFRTPANSGKSFTFESTRPSYTLHPEPKEEWLQWNSSIPVDDATATAVKVKFPQPLAAKFHWREAWKPLISWRKYEGMVLPVGSGVIGPVELLKPDTAEKSLTSVTFQIGGVNRSRHKPTYIDLGNGLCYMQLELDEKTERMSQTDLASVKDPVDCWIVTNADQPKALAAAKLTASNAQWSVEANSGYQASWHGAPVVCRDRSSPAFGKVIGIFLVGKNGASIALFSKNIEQSL